MGAKPEIREHATKASAKTGIQPHSFSYTLNWTES